MPMSVLWSRWQAGASAPGYGLLREGMRVGGRLGLLDWLCFVRDGGGRMVTRLSVWIAGVRAAPRGEIGSPWAAAGRSLRVRVGS
jgi:hypothetical protein